MPPKPVEAGKSFIEQVLAKVPEAERSGLQTAASALLGNELALTELGNGVLRQEDYSRGMAAVQAELDRLKTIETQQKEWFTANQALLEKGRKAARPATETDPNPDDPAPAVDRDAILADVTKLIDARERQVAPVMAAITTLVARHGQMFAGEVLDTQAVLAEASTKGLTLDQAYTSLHGTRVAEKAKAAEDARINAEVEKRFTERMRTQHNRPPDAVGGGAGSPLDALEPAKPGLGVQDLVDEYNTLVAQGQGAPVQR